MIRLIARYLFLAGLALTFALSAACSGDSTVAGGGGISGTGVQTVTVGQVDGFGSVFVNGVEFKQAAGARVMFSFDNISSSQESRLRPGMQVTVNGSVDQASDLGLYDRIEYRPELRGPLDASSVDLTAGTFSILGRTVRLDSASLFDGVSDLVAIFNLQSQSPELEVSGTIDATGEVRATRVALVSSSLVNGSAVQIKGFVTSITDNSLVIGGGTTINISNALLVPSGAFPVVGNFVEVRATYSSGTITATRVERKNTLPDPGTARLKIRGLAVTSIAGSQFILAGPNGPVSVNVDGTTIFWRGAAQSTAGIVSPGAHLEVEGTVGPGNSLNGLTAAKISSETGRTVRLDGLVTAKSAASITVNGVTVTVVPGTSYRDNSSAAIQQFGLADIGVGDYLRIEGISNVAANVTASQVQRFDAISAAILQGSVSGIDSTLFHLVILGVSVDGTTATCSIGNNPVSFAVFAAAVTPSATLVKAKGNYSGTLFTATELQIQP